MTDIKPLVSVIIPVFNCERFIGAALESIFAQDYRPIEVVVLDDGSTDQTATIVRARTEVRYIWQQNQGASIARNNGILASRGELIAFLDADDLWTPNKLTNQVQFLLEHPELQCVISHVRFFLEPNHPLPKGFQPKLLERESVGRLPSALLARRSAFDTVGLFDPTLRTSEDVDWFARANDLGVTLGIVPQVLLHKRVHGSNASSSAPNKNLLEALHRSVQRKHSESK